MNKPTAQKYEQDNELEGQQPGAEGARFTDGLAGWTDAVAGAGQRQAGTYSNAAVQCCLTMKGLAWRAALQHDQPRPEALDGADHGSRPSRASSC